MQISKNKTMTSLIALILVLSVVIPFLTTVKADSSLVNVQTYVFIVATPNPVGLGQPISVVMMESLVPTQFPNGTSVVWQNLVLTTTDPDGKVTNATYSSDYVGARNVQVVPDKLGNWTFQFSFLGQTGAATYLGKYFIPTTSEKIVVAVQQDAVALQPENPLPTDYWTRPINAENRYWASIAGNWLCKGYDVGSLDANFNPYTTAPSTAHIVWTKSIAMGGIAGGNSIETYNPIWINPLGSPVIINGLIYYSLDGGLECQDIRTGQQIWWQNSTSVNCGQVLQFNSAQGMGDFAYLWVLGSTYKMYSARTGNWILNLANASVGSSGPGSSPAPIMGPNGELLVYLIGGTTPNKWLAMWNSTAVTGMMTAAYGVQIAQEWSWTPPQGATLDWRTGIQWNKTLSLASGNPAITKLDPKQPDVFYSRQSFTMPDMTVVCQDTGISLKPGEEGKILWGPTNRTAKPSAASLDVNDGVFVEYTKETGTCDGYDMYTGELLWTNNQISTTGYHVYQQMSINAGYGKEYFGTYEGITYCMDIKNGSLLWKFYGGNSGLETPYGEWPFYGGSTIADQKLYAVTGEHTPQNPIWKGERMFCIDVNTGENLWNITGLWFNPAIADGYALAVNYETNTLYSFGKGLTQTTLAATPKVAEYGSTVLLEGTVTDQSPGQTCLGIPAAGTPVISDKDMTSWMEYLYQQRPKPNDATGVTVSLTALDTNGNIEYIGNTTSDATGNYVLSWIPQIPGTYTITANFGGSGSYYPSSTETHITVGESVTPTPTQSQLDLAPTQMYISYAVVAIIVAIAIVGVVLVLVLRKRP